MNLGEHSFHWALGGSDTSGGIEQNREELMMLCEFIKSNEIKTFLEIGMGSGLLQRFMIKEMDLICEGINPVNVNGATYLGKSQDKDILQAVKSNYDMIFVDGDHNYDSVKADFENYRDKCSYMAFHDILGKRDCEGVNKLWNEIHNDYAFHTFIAKNINHASGIGVIKIR